MHTLCLLLGYPRRSGAGTQATRRADWCSAPACGVRGTTAPYRDTVTESSIRVQLKPWILVSFEEFLALLVYLPPDAFLVYARVYSLLSICLSIALLPIRLQTQAPEANRHKILFLDADSRNFSSGGE